MPGTDPEPEVWTCVREAAGTFFVSSRLRRHACGARCAVPTVQVAGVHVCPISRVRRWACIEEAAPAEEQETKKRSAVTDPMDSNGAADKTHRGMELARKLFKKSLLNSMDELGAFVQNHLKSARAQGANLAKETPRLAAEARGMVLLAEDLRETIAEAVDIARFAKDSDFEAVLCAAFNYASEAGLAFKGRCVVKKQARLSGLMPAVCAFAGLGVDPSFVKHGVNTISGLLPTVVAEGANKRIREILPVPLSTKRRRVM